ncbi:hypothetical protein ACS15_1723 [Ralstonia insidiosa]|uniref:DUF2523 domain-containing protein n=1 Tax=Ralstonia insidiosa TaxID=190721 RepID=A0AAC9BDL2_9RALS|nr:DUF2523 family protein [Ralstonia insidiosa]ANH72118.1 hypothetical protein ACS15_1723 [Ralstonia insidiosa]
MFDSIINALSGVLAWFGKVFAAVFQALWDITIDLCIAGFDLFLSAIGSLIAAAPAPQFLTQYSLQSLVGQMGSDILYFVGVFNISQGLAMIGAGVAFRLFVRKLFTLGQW